MKKCILLGLLFLTVTTLSAQEQFGPATFIVPEGWNVTREHDKIVLEQPAQKGVVCKIIVSLATKGAVTTQPEYVNFRSIYGGAGITYPLARGTITKYEANGLISFFSMATTSERTTTVRSYFYSLSNGTQTLYYQLLASNNDCVDVFNEFQSGLKMELDESPSLAGVKKKAPAPAPGGPAPIM